MAMYSDLEQEFHIPMQNAGLDFKNEYSKALQSFENFNFDTDERHAAIKAVLQEILNRYSESKPKTTGGRIGRFFAKIAAILLPFYKGKK
jgi:hypothetical protein